MKNKEYEAMLKEIQPIIQKNAGFYSKGNTFFYEELVSAGNIGAYECLKNWDESKSSLKTYMINNSKYAQLNRLRDLVKESGRNIVVDDIETFTEKIDDLPMFPIEYSDYLKKALEKLKTIEGERNVEILIAYYGFNDDKKTMQELSQIYSISTERTKQLIHRMIKELRKNIQRQISQEKFTKK